MFRKLLHIHRDGLLAQKYKDSKVISEWTKEGHDRVGGRQSC